MREDLLHFIWKYRKLPFEDLLTSKGQQIFIVNVGTHNHLSGPDFFNAQIRIDGQLWAGNVEMHLNSSNWYAHRHEKDSNYNNVILHVVWEDDGAVFRSDNSQIPTLALKNLIPQNLLNAYQKLFDKSKKSFINCENDIANIDSFTIQNWLDRLYFERLERKADTIVSLLNDSKNDWEQVLFMMLLRNFGLNINGESFFSLANAIDFSVVRKLQSNVFKLESIFYGLSHLLDDDDILDEYYLAIRKEYKHQCKKFDLSADGVLKPEFFKLRPPNFPTIRLSQIARLYGKDENLFDKIIRASNLEDLYSIFEVTASGYWDNHFTFGKVSKKNTKKLTKKFIDLLILNTILPLKFCHAKHLGKDMNENILSIVSELKAEDNSIVSTFKGLGLQANDAKDSQALIQLYKEYCTKNSCLECAVGSSLMGK